MISKEQDKLYNKYMALVHEYQDRAMGRCLEMIRWAHGLRDSDDPYVFLHAEEEAAILNCLDIHELALMIQDFDQQIHDRALAKMSENL